MKRRSHKTTAMRSTTPAQRLADGAGLSVESICRRARISEAYFARLARVGDAPAHLAERLAALCRCEPSVFLWGLEVHQVAQVDGAVGKPAMSGAGDVSAHAAKPRSRHRNPPSLHLL